MKRLLLLTIIFFSLSVFLGSAELKFKGLVQSWISYADEDSTGGQVFGFSFRRIRFQPFGSFSKSVKWVLCFGWDRQVPSLLDAYLDFEFAKSFALRIGQYTVPGTISSSLTSSSALDLVERPEITLRWSDHSGLTSFRAIGIQLHGMFLKNRLYYALMVANPRTLAVFNPSIKQPEYANENNGISFWARIEANLIEGLRCGTFFGWSDENHNEITRTSYGAHLFFVKNAINIKCEYISGQVEEKENETTYRGMYVVFGYKISKLEPIVRYGMYIPNNREGDDSGVEQYNSFSLGLNYFVNQNIKIQVNYIIRDELMIVDSDEKIRNNILYMNVQYSF